MSEFREDRSICGCANSHGIRRIVLTGGPGAGKTAVLELIKQSFCPHVEVLKESAGIVFGGGFPRRSHVRSGQAAKRAIFHVQRELENECEARNPALILCDRGTVDGGAYWHGQPDMWRSLDTTLSAEVARYSSVIHLRVPSLADGYNNRNPLRVESAAEAEKIDQRIAALWAGHPRYHAILPEHVFIEKAQRVLKIVKEEIPECCRHHVLQLIDHLQARSARGNNV